jgi:hypothetical protein
MMNHILKAVFKTTYNYERSILRDRNFSNLFMSRSRKQNFSLKLEKILEPTTDSFFPFCFSGIKKNHCVFFTNEIAKIKN